MLDLAAVQLRPFGLADADAVEPWLSGPGLSLPGGNLRREWPQRLLADQRIVASIGIVAGGGAGGGPGGDLRVGLVRLDCGPDLVAEVTLVVAPGCRRHGVGSAMFGAALRQARRLGLRRLVVNVDLMNGPALAFFAAQGFEQEGLAGNRVRMSRIVHACDHASPLDI